MLFRKTPTSERGNYVYRFSDGMVSVIAEGDEAAVWIKSLHSFDDAEVYNNIKNSRPQLDPGRRRLWKSGRLSIRVKSRRRIGICRWTD